jgi:hypothetical protein
VRPSTPFNRSKVPIPSSIKNNLRHSGVDIQTQRQHGDRISLQQESTVQAESGNFLMKTTVCSTGRADEVYCGSGAPCEANRGAPVPE